MRFSLKMVSGVGRDIMKLHFTNFSDAIRVPVASQQTHRRTLITNQRSLSIVIFRRTIAFRCTPPRHLQRTSNVVTAAVEILAPGPKMQVLPNDPRVSWFCRHSMYRFLLHSVSPVPPSALNESDSGSVPICAFIDNSDWICDSGAVTPWL